MLNNSDKLPTGEGRGRKAESQRISVITAHVSNQNKKDYYEFEDIFRKRHLVKLEGIEIEEINEECGV